MISFNSIKKGFELSYPGYYRDWLNAVVKIENLLPGKIQYIFCDDDFLLEINRQYLNHDFFTDVITFPDSQNSKVISADIYVSVDRVEENASSEKVDFQNELARVLVHGMLHLIGYNDHTGEEKKQMRAKEDYYLNLLP